MFYIIYKKARRGTKVFMLTIVFTSCVLSVCVTSCQYKIVAAPRKVNLAGLEITAIPDSVFNITNLKILNLHGNDLNSISYRIGELTELEELYLGSNRISSLPEEMIRLQNLKILSLPFNDLDTLPSFIGSLVNLEILILNGNRLKKLPTTIGSLKHLKNLQLKYNLLEELPNEIVGCDSLEFIYLNRNALSALPDSIGWLPNLKEVYLSQAGMMLQIPSGFCEHRKLEILEVDQTAVIPLCLFVWQTNRLRIIRR